ncbi:hypothetical protein QYE76_062319 [Lolium multiflorum]|uniref:Uncharacterized protein n=1 Tax=Lolium multiflorum TaxID=4521 RepID=A0AAD8S3D3_LOLMU|nr:hypothetical protein QYE76_062319 [Lolium multiflorum]
MGSAPWPRAGHVALVRRWQSLPPDPRNAATRQLARKKMERSRGENRGAAALAPAALSRHGAASSASTWYSQELLLHTNIDIKSTHLRQIFRNGNHDLESDTQRHTTVEWFNQGRDVFVKACFKFCLETARAPGQGCAAQTTLDAELNAEYEESVVTSLTTPSWLKPRGRSTCAAGRWEKVIAYLQHSEGKATGCLVTGTPDLMKPTEFPATAAQCLAVPGLPFRQSQDPVIARWKHGALRGTTQLSPSVYGEHEFSASLVWLLVNENEEDDEAESEQPAQQQKKKKLWGLLVCLHESPRYPFQPVVCEFLAQVFAVHINRSWVQKQLREKNILRMQTMLSDILFREASPLTIVSGTPNIMDLVKCDGAALYNHGGARNSVCVMLQPESQMNLAFWLSDVHQGFHWPEY